MDIGKWMEMELWLLVFDEDGGVKGVHFTIVILIWNGD